MTTTTAEPGARRGRGPFAADERLLQQHRVGPVDRLPAGGILALLPQLPDWPCRDGAPHQEAAGSRHDPGLAARPPRRGLAGPVDGLRRRPGHRLDRDAGSGRYPPGGHQEARAHRRAGLPADVPGRPARLRLPGRLPGERTARPGARDHAARYVRPPRERRGRTRAERPRPGRRAVRDQQDRAAYRHRRRRADPRRRPGDVRVERSRRPSAPAGPGTARGLGPPGRHRGDPGRHDSPVRAAARPADDRGTGRRLRHLLPPGPRRARPLP